MYGFFELYDNPNQVTANMQKVHEFGQKVHKVLDKVHDFENKKSSLIRSLTVLIMFFLFPSPPLTGDSAPSWGGGLKNKVSVFQNFISEIISNGFQ